MLEYALIKLLIELCLYFAYILQFYTTQRGCFTWKLQD